MSRLGINRESEQFILDNIYCKPGNLKAKYFSSLKNCNENSLSFWDGHSEIKNKLYGTIIIGSNSSEPKTIEGSKISILRGKVEAEKIFWHALGISAYSIDKENEKSYIETDFGAKIWTTSHLGQDIKIGAGSIIGFEGIATYRDIDNVMRRIPHIGQLSIGSRTQISHNVVINRGILEDTVVGEDCCIGTNSIIGHNCEIGENCFIGPNVTICGSVKIGKNTIIGAGSVLTNGITIGEHSYICAGSTVVRSTKANSKVMGNPARGIIK